MAVGVDEGSWVRPDAWSAPRRRSGKTPTASSTCPTRVSASVRPTWIRVSNGLRGSGQCNGTGYRHSAGMGRLCDEDEKLLLRKAGFREEARLRGQLRDGDEWQDLLVYCRQITLDPAPYSSQEEYYGSRKAWQAERVSQLPQA